MPVPKKYLADFEPGKIYHVYNRTNNNELLFRSNENRRYFLSRYIKYLCPFAYTYSWCLLPNHFHFLIQVKTSESIKAYLKQQDITSLAPIEVKFFIGEINTGMLVQHAFKRMFQSYSMAFNKQNNRKGNLFYKSFKRVEITSDEQLTRTIVYIHANPVKHKLCDDFRNYEWSSWPELVSGKTSICSGSEAVKWFGNRERFISDHECLSSEYLPE